MSHALPHAWLLFIWNVGLTHLILTSWFTPQRHWLASDPLPWPEDPAAWRTYFTVSDHDLRSQRKKRSGKVSDMQKTEDLGWTLPGAHGFGHSLCILWSFGLNCLRHSPPTSPPTTQVAWQTVTHSSWQSSSALQGTFSDFYPNRIFSIVLPLHLLTPTHCIAITY